MNSSQQIQINSLIETARHHAFQRQDFMAAEHCYRQVLTLAPNNAEALAGVGQSLYWRHKRAQARLFMHKAVKTLLRKNDKSQSGFLMELANQLQMWSEIELALQLARAVIKHSPDDPHALYMMAACLHRLNHPDQAIAILKRLLKRIPDEASCHILMALLEIDKGQEISARERLEKLLLSPQDDEQKARICLELSRVYDKLKNHTAAFDMLIASGDLNRRLPNIQHIDSELIFKKLDQYKNGFTTELLRRWSVEAFQDALPAPVFLMGFLRSGTTLTEQVLSAHKQVITSDENTLLHETIAELERISQIKDNLPLALESISIEQAQQLRQFYWQRAREEYGPDVFSKRFINKVALNSIETGFIATLFPEAKLIFALRDPRDICLSCAMQSFTPSTATINMLSWTGIARQYAAVMDLWLTLRDKISPRYMELRYEDTVNDFENSFRRVFDLLEIPWQDDVAQYHKNVSGRFVSTPSFAAVSQPLYRSAVARWQAYEAHYQSIMPILQPYIKAFGYS